MGSVIPWPQGGCGRGGTGGGGSKATTEAGRPCPGSRGFTGHHHSSLHHAITEAAPKALQKRCPLACKVWVTENMLSERLGRAAHNLGA